MANKSRRKRGKGRGIAAAAVAPQQLATPTYQPAAPVVKEPAPTATRYPHIGAELRRIGMLGGIMLAILVVLASVLS